MSISIVILFILILFAVVIALQSAVLFLLLRLFFRLGFPTYRKAVFVVLLLALAQLILLLFSLVLPFPLLVGFLSLIVPFVIFHLLIKKYYQSVWWRSLCIYVLFIVCSFILSFFLIKSVRDYVAEPFYVRGTAMEPSLANGDYAMIKKFGTLPVVRGEIVVFRYPKDQRQFFIKRIIGLPGERVEIRDGDVRINTAILSEPYLEEQKTPGQLTIDLSSDQWFVLGDNRGSSLDSRSFGPVATADIIGKPFLILQSSRWDFLRYLHWNNVRI